MASNKTFRIICLAIILMRLLFPRIETLDVTAFLSWDDFSHYAWLPAFFIHDDAGLHNFAWIGQLLRQYQPLIGYQQAFVPGSSTGLVFAAPMGAAILFAPFFMAGHFAALIAGYPADGLSLPYQVAMVVGGLSWSITGLWFLKKTLAGRFTDAVAAKTILVVALASGYLGAAAFRGASAENLLFTLYAVLVFASTRLTEKPSAVKAAATGLVAALIFLCRPYDLVLLIPWLLLMVWRLGMKHLHLSGFTLLFFIAAGSFQVVYWKIYTGHYFFTSGTAFDPTVFTFIPYAALLAVPVACFIRKLAEKKVVLRIGFFSLFAVLAIFQTSMAIREQVKLRHAADSPGSSFHRYDHAEPLPVSQRYSAKTYQDKESDLLGHPEWFRTRRIYTLEPIPARLNSASRYSPGLNAPLKNYSGARWIGIRAKAMIRFNGPAAENSGNLVITLLRDGQPFNWQGAPIGGGQMQPDAWNEITLNYIISDPKENDILQAYVWYTGSSQAYVGNLTVTLFEKENDGHPEQR